MISNVWDLTHVDEARDRLASPAPPRAPFGRPGRALAAIGRRLAARRVQARRRDELARLPDALRADVGLPPREPLATPELRFIATPDRLAVFAPGHRVPRRR